MNPRFVFSKFFPSIPTRSLSRFDEIPEVRACATPDSCEIVDPIEFAKHGETASVIGERFFQIAKEMLKSSLTRAG